MRDAAFTRLETERLVVRRFSVADAVAFAAYRADPDVARFQSWQDYTLADAQLFITELSGTDPGVPGEWFQFAVAERDGDGLVGDCALVLDAGDPPTAEIGYTLDPRAHGRGYATEAMRALIAYAFTGLGVARVQAVTDVRNTPSIAAAQRLGMRLVATVQTTFKGEPCQEHTFELTRDG